MFRIVALSREYGSGGAVIASQVATELGWELIDRACIERAAAIADVTPDAAARCDERVPSWMERLAKNIRVGAPESYPPPRPGAFDPDRMQALAKQVVLEAAARPTGCVIVGRGSQCILRDRDDVLQVFVYAPFEDRFRRLRPRYSSDHEATAEIERMERARDDFIRHYFHCDRHDRCLYHLMINSALGMAAATRLIVDAVKASQQQEVAAAR
jgi:cytidylate kinase